MLRARWRTSPRGRAYAARELAAGAACSEVVTARPAAAPAAGRRRRSRPPPGQIGFQLDDYVLPRLASIDAPVLTVVGGSTGAGKSTLVNSLVRHRVSEPGVIRPTTRAPVLVHHPDDARWFADDRILPGLARSTGSGRRARDLQLVPLDAVPPGLAILDAPDVDSVVTENRQLAAQLLDAADLWLFVTSAARYADAVPWDYLAAAAERSAAVAVVLDRVPPRAMRDVPPHLGQMMSERGLADSPLFAVPETAVDAEGLLPDAAVAPIRGWLAALAQDRSRRAAVVQQTLDGAVGSLVARTPARRPGRRRAGRGGRPAAGRGRPLVRRGRPDGRGADRGRHAAARRGAGPLARLRRDRRVLPGARGEGRLAARPGRRRDQGRAGRRPRPQGRRRVGPGVAAGAGGRRGRRAGRVVLAVDRGGARRARPDARPTCRTARPSSGASAEQMIRDWQGAVLDLVADEGMTKRSRARFLAFGVNGVGVALMILVFAHTGGLVGAEVGVAGGTAILAQRVLEAVFGDQAVRRLAETAKAELDARVEALMAEELLRYHALLDGLGVDAGLGPALREAAAAVDAARAVLPTGAAATRAAGVRARRRR